MINCNTAKDMSEERTELSRLLKHSTVCSDYFSFFLLLLSDWNSQQGHMLCSLCNTFPSRPVFENIKSHTSSFPVTLSQMDISPNRRIVNASVSKLSEE